MAETGTPHRHGHEHHQQPGATGRARQEEGQHQERHWTHLWTQAQESRQKGILSVWSKLGLYVGTGLGGGGGGIVYLGHYQLRTGSVPWGNPKFVPRAWQDCT